MAACIILGLGIAGCGDDADDDSTTETTAPTEVGSDPTTGGATDTAPAETTTTEPAAPTDATPIELASLPASDELNDVRLTVTEVGTTSMGERAAGAVVEDGEELFYARVEIENLGAEPRTFGPTTFTMGYEADGRSDTESPTFGESNAGANLATGETAPGDTATGVIAFILPEAAELTAVNLLVNTGLDDLDAEIVIPLA